jgi:hypothetical protein
MYGKVTCDAGLLATHLTAWLEQFLDCCGVYIKKSGDDNCPLPKPVFALPI